MPIQMQPLTPHVLGFDLGGTHVAALSSLAPSGTRPVTVALDHRAEMRSIVAAIVQAASAALQFAGLRVRPPDGLAFAVPGPFDLSQGVSRMKHKFHSLYEVALRYELASALSALFACRPERITFLNDADAFLLGELCRHPARRALGITLGTGIGSAFAVDGCVVSSGPGVPAQRRSLLPALERRDDGRCDLHPRHSCPCTTGWAASWPTCARVAHGCPPHDPGARQTMEQFGETLGQVLRILCAGFRPDLIVLGGSITRSSETFAAHLLSQLPMPRPELHFSSETEASAIAGALRHVEPEHIPFRLRRRRCWLGADSTSPTALSSPIMRISAVQTAGF